MASHPGVMSPGGSRGRRPRTPLLVAGAIALAAAVIAASLLAGVHIGSEPAPAVRGPHPADVEVHARPKGEVVTLSGTRGVLVIHVMTLTSPNRLVVDVQT